MNTEKKLPAMKKIKITKVTKIVKLFQGECSTLSNNVNQPRGKY